MTTWNEFAQQRPQLADAGRALLYQHGVGLAFMATIRPDTRPRLHPMCPLLNDDGLFAFIIPSPKQRDLLRDGWYAMHSFPRPDNEDAFYVTGRAELRTDLRNYGDFLLAIPGAGLSELNTLPLSEIAFGSSWNT